MALGPDRAPPDENCPERREEPDQRRTAEPSEYRDDRGDAGQNEQTCHEPSDRLRNREAVPQGK